MFTVPGHSAAIPRAAIPPPFPHGRGPQGDVICINNFVRPVRNIDPETVQLVQPDRHAAACCHGQSRRDRQEDRDGTAARPRLSTGNGTRTRYETAAPSTARLVDQQWTTPAALPRYLPSPRRSDWALHCDEKPSGIANPTRVMENRLQWTSFWTC